MEGQIMKAREIFIVLLYQLIGFFLGFAGPAIFLFVVHYKEVAENKEQAAFAYQYCLLTGIIGSFVGLAIKLKKISFSVTMAILGVIMGPLFMPMFKSLLPDKIYVPFIVTLLFFVLGKLLRLFLHREI